MAFRIKHKPSGRYLKKQGSIDMSVWDCLSGRILDGTTDKTGHLYATRKGAEYPFRLLTDKNFEPLWYRDCQRQPNDWELEEL